MQMCFFSLRRACSAVVLISSLRSEKLEIVSLPVNVEQVQAGGSFLTKEIMEQAHAREAELMAQNIGGKSGLLSLSYRLGSRRADIVALRRRHNALQEEGRRLTQENDRAFLPSRMRV